MPIKTFLEACKQQKVDPKKALPKLAGTLIRFQKAQIAYAKLLIIAEALNEGWTPDWDNENEWKYWPWFYLNKPGFRFHDSPFSNASTDTAGGSRLCFRTRELSDYAAKTFISLWEEMMVIPKPVKKVAKKKK